MDSQIIYARMPECSCIKVRKKVREKEKCTDGEDHKYIISTTQRSLVVLKQLGVWTGETSDLHNRSNLFALLFCIVHVLSLIHI